MKSILLVLFLCGASLGQTATFDMLDWMTMDSFGSHTKGVGAAMWSVMDSAQNQFYWVKNAKGYPWDVKKYDANFIYDSITEVNWTDPHAFKNILGRTARAIRSHRALCPTFQALRPKTCGRSLFRPQAPTSKSIPAVPVTQNRTWAMPKPRFGDHSTNRWEEICRPTRRLFTSTGSGAAILRTATAKPKSSSR